MTHSATTIAEAPWSKLEEPRERERVVNFFTEPEAAARYSAHRPSGHLRVLQLVAEFLKEELPVDRALDVGCGTGHSTVALLPYAKSVMGIDVSSAMLAQAQPHDRIGYRKGYAEALPFRTKHFDLVTVSAAYHWFDHERFLFEAARVLRGGGWLVLYKAGSHGRMPDQPAFEKWRREVLRARYPKVARNNEVLSAEEAAQFGFREMKCERALYPVTHTLDQHIDNLLTHSSVIRVVDHGLESLAEARRWFRDELAPFFPGGQAQLLHEARIHVLQRNAG